MGKIEAGRLILVENLHKKNFTNAKTWYYAMWVEDADGGNERCWLMTNKDIQLAENRAERNVEDCIAPVNDDADQGIALVDAPRVRGRIIPVYNKKRKHWNSKYAYSAVFVEDTNGENQRCLLLTDYEIHRVEHRAKRNQEDIPQKSLITDILD